MISARRTASVFMALVLLATIGCGSSSSGGGAGGGPGSGGVSGSGGSKDAGVVSTGGVGTGGVGAGGVGGSGGLKDAGVVSTEGVGSGGVGAGGVGGDSGGAGSGGVGAGGVGGGGASASGGSGGAPDAARDVATTQPDAAADLAAKPDVGASGSDAVAAGSLGGTAGGNGGGGAGGNGGTAPDAGSTSTPDFVWYVLDETQGSTAKDSSSHHYDITNLVGVTWNEGANFDGISGGGSVNVDSSYRSPPITISAWLTPKARSDETSNQYSLVPYPTNAVGDDIPSEFGYGIGLNVWTDGGGGSALAVEDVDSCQNPPATPHPCMASQNVGSAFPTFVAGQEYFILAAVGMPPADGGASSVANVYVNGSLFDATTAGVIAGGPTTLWLGVHNDDTNYGTKSVFSGRIRDVRVYKRELVATEVAQLYALGPTTSAP